MFTDVRDTGEHQVNTDIQLTMTLSDTHPHGSLADKLVNTSSQPCHTAHHDLTNFHQRWSRDMCIGIVLTRTTRPFAAVLNVHLIEKMNEAGKPTRKGGIVFFVDVDQVKVASM